MNIAIDISPLSSGHKVRGVGFYLRHLKEALEKYYPEHTYILFKDQKEIPSNTDIVHYPYFDPFFITQPLAKKFPTVVTVHDLIPLKFPQQFPAGFKGKLKWFLNKGILLNMDAVITDSQSSKVDIEEIADVPEEKIHVVSLAAGENFKLLADSSSEEEKIRAKNKELITKYNLPDKFILYVGDATWNKNLPRLLEAVKLAKLPLVMVGKALTEENFDKKNIWNKDLVTVQSEIKKNEMVQVLGFVPDEDLVSLYNLATVFIQPSLYEGFGLPVLEAMVSGTPVVTTHESSLPEVAGEAAYFVDAYSAEDIAKGLEKVFRDSSLQKELSDKGLQRVKNFSWEKTAEQMINIYKELV